MKIYKKIRPLLVLEGFEVSNFRKEDIIDYSAGVVLAKKVGDTVNTDATVVELVPKK